MSTLKTSQIFKTSFRKSITTTPIFILLCLLITIGNLIFFPLIAYNQILVNSPTANTAIAITTSIISGLISYYLVLVTIKYSINRTDKLKPKFQDTFNISFKQYISTIIVNLRIQAPILISILIATFIFNTPLFEIIFYALIDYNLGAIIGLFLLVIVIGFLQLKNFLQFFFANYLILDKQSTIKESLIISKTQTLQIVDNKTPSIKKIFTTKPSLLLKFILQILVSLLLAGAMVVLIGALGFGTFWLIQNGNHFLAILPALTLLIAVLVSTWLVLSLMQITNVLIDTNCTVTESFKQSYKISLRQKFSIIGFYMAIGIVWLIGLLLFGVGILVAYPVTLYANSHFYRSLYTKTNK